MSPIISIFIQPKDGNETRGDDEVFSPKPFIKKGKIEVEMQQEDRTDKNDAIAPAEDPQNDGNVFVKGENVSRLLKDGYKVTTSQTTGRSVNDEFFSPLVTKVLVNNCVSV